MVWCVDDGLMTGWKRVLAWASVIVFGLALIGLGVYFVIAGLDTVDAWASVIGIFTTLIGLALSVYALTRRPPAQPLTPGGQRGVYSSGRGGV
jgi:uncharacterized membrane protein HdeD (DUF308 family)